jgi:hypothetical protein
MSSQATLDLPDEFVTSYEDFQKYPVNLVQKTAYSGFINAYMERLKDLDPKLFSHLDYCISTLDYETPQISDVSGKCIFREDEHAILTIQENDIHNDDELKAWLGHKTVTAQNEKAAQRIELTRTDPFCRFM